MYDYSCDICIVCLFVHMCLCLLVILLSRTQILEDVFSSLLFHGNRWNEGPIGYGIAVKGPPKGSFMRKKSQLHLDLEAGRIEAIITVCMGMNNRKEITSKMNQKHL